MFSSVVRLLCSSGWLLIISMLIGVGDLVMVFFILGLMLM